jgi:hypothetical protein
LLAFWNDEPTATNLLADPKWEKRDQDTNFTSQALMSLTPQWVWPKELNMDTSLFLGEGKSLWLLTPRKLWNAPNQPQEYAQFSDDRHATLFHFVPEMRVPFSVPIRFLNHNQACDPFDTAQSGATSHTIMDRFGASPLGLGSPDSLMLWLNTPEDLVLAVPNFMGYWRIPKSAIETRFAAQRNSLINEVRTQAAPINPPAGTNAIKP